MRATRRSKRKKTTQIHKHTHTVYNESIKPLNNIDNVIDDITSDINEIDLNTLREFN